MKNSHVTSGKKLRRTAKSLLSLLLCGGMALSGIGGGTTVHAASDSVQTKEINIGANGLNISADGWSYKTGNYLYFGSYNNTPVKYRVLTRHNGTADVLLKDSTPLMTTDASDNLLLDSDAALFTSTMAGTYTSYEESDIYKFLHAGQAKDGSSLFDAKEVGAVASTTLAEGTENLFYARFPYLTTGASDNLSFLLTESEVISYYTGERSIQKTSDWWSRSYVQGAYKLALYVVANGTTTGMAQGTTEKGVAPAVNVDLGAVLFLSDQAMDKTSAIAKIDTSSNREWKATLKDASKTIQTTGEVTREEQTITVPYSYTGADVDQISIVLTSGDITAENSTILYYGKLADGSQTSGTASFELPSGLPSRYKAYILAEDTNDWMHTDYASAPVEVTIPAGSDQGGSADNYTVTFNSNEGSSVAAQSVKKGETAEEPAAPTKSGYAFGGWYIDADCTEAYDFSQAVTANITLYAKWVGANTVSSIDSSYTETTDETADDTNKKDLDQKNYQKSADSTDETFTYKAVEWTDKAAGKAKITISTKQNVQSSGNVVYAFTKCTAHHFTSTIAAQNIAFLVEKYGAVDVVVADGRSTSGTRIFENITMTDETAIQTMLEENIVFKSDSHYNVALYYALCKYFENHTPSALYVSFDSDMSDTLSMLPTSETPDIWDQLKAYKKSGRYFSIGSDPNKSIAQVSSYAAANAIRAGLANPLVFVSMESMTTTSATKVDQGYTVSFKQLEDQGVTFITTGVTITDPVDSRFEITGVTSNLSDVDIATKGQTVTAEFNSLDSNTVGEIYIEVQLKDKTDEEGLTDWLTTNSGPATVTYTDPDGNEQTSTVENSPKVYYDTDISEDKYKITTGVTNGTIDAECEVPSGSNKTIHYTPDKGYQLKSVTVDGVEVDITAYPNSYTFKDIDKDHDIQVVFEKTYDITTTVTGGSITPSTTVGEGGEKTITYTPNTGYVLKSVKVDGVEVDITQYPDSYTFTDINENHNIEVVYEKDPTVPVNEYEITTTVTGGSITPSETVEEGGEKTVTYTPSEGYKLKSVTVDGVEIDITQYPDSYTFTNIDGDHAIVVVFEPETEPEEGKHTITTTVTSGSITPSTTVDDNGDTTITYTPNEGYRLKSVKVDGTEVSLTDYPDSYTFTGITEDHSVEVVYEKIPEYPITTLVTNGNITPSAKVTEGGDMTIEYSPKEGYELKSVKVDGVEVDITANPNSYTFTNITDKHEIEVVYAKTPYTITTTVTGEGGSITPTDTVEEGGEKTITYTPNEGYKVKTVKVDGVEIDLTQYPNSYPFTNVDGDHTVEVEFEKVHTITTTVTGEGGTITPSTTVDEGGEATITYTPDKGYKVKTVKVDGVEIDLTQYPNSYPFTNVDGDHSVEVVFEKTETTYDITTSVTGGTITPSEKVNGGDSKTITYKANSGYKLKSITVDGQTIDISKYPDSYTFSDIAANHTITVVFEKTSSSHHSSSSSSTGNTGSSAKTTTGAKTADMTNIALPAAMAGSSVLAMAGAAWTMIFKKKKNQ